MNCGAGGAGFLEVVVAIWGIGGVGVEDFDVDELAVVGTGVGLGDISSLGWECCELGEGSREDSDSDFNGGLRSVVVVGECGEWTGTDDDSSLTL